MGDSLSSQCFWLCVLLAVFFLGPSNAEELAPRKMCGRTMECVPRYLCDENDDVIIDGHNIFDYRSGDNGCDWLEKCCSVGKQNDEDKSDYEPGDCGYTNPEGVGLTIKNPQRDESQFGEFPWTVMVLEKTCIGRKCDYVSLGGGSLLAPNVILTTAHIIGRNNPDLVVRAGEWDTRSVGEPRRHEDRDVSTKIIHEQFLRSTGFNDIALLIVESPFKLDKHIGTICLPGPSSEIDETNCVSTGWGKKDIKHEFYPHVMKKVQLPIVDPPRCQQMLRRTRLGRYYRLDESFLCAGGEQNKDACTGDGGGPLVCPLKNDPKRYQLVGAVSWGISCNDKDVPGVYVDVAKQKSWIIAQLELHSIDL